MKKYALMPLIFYLLSAIVHFMYSIINIGETVPRTYIMLGYGLLVVPLFSIVYGYISGRANKNPIAPTLNNSILAGFFSSSSYIVSLINKNENRWFLLMSIGVFVMVGLITYFPAVQGAKKGKEKAEKIAEKEAQKNEKQKQIDAKKKEEERKIIEEQIKAKLAKEKEDKFREQLKVKTKEQIDEEIKKMAEK